MKMHLLPVAWALLDAACLGAADPIEAARDQATPTAVELYSWKGENGVWNFSMLPNKSALYTEREIFDSKATIQGVDHLKEALAKLVPGEELIWESSRSSRAPESGGSSLEYPDRALLLEIARFVRSRKLKLTILGDQSRVPFEQFAP